MDDLISRQTAIELVKDVCDAIMSGCESWYDPETEDEVYMDIREVDAILKCNKEVRIALRNMSSTQPERINGHWIAMEKKNLFRCSECGAVIYSESEYDRNEFHKFCGRCGAEMGQKGENNESN